MHQLLIQEQTNVTQASHLHLNTIFFLIPTYEWKQIVCLSRYLLLENEIINNEI